MERSRRYEHISGYSGLLAGAAALIGCTLLSCHLVPFDSRSNFVAVWAAVFVVAFAGHLVFTFGRARQRGEPVWSRQARTVLLAVLPNFGAALAVTVLVWRLGRVDRLPAVWLTLYGCGVLATSFFAPRSIAWLGGSCLALGAADLISQYSHPILMMGLGFGGAHIAFGGAVLAMEWRQARQRAFWKQVEHLAAVDE